MRNRKKTRTARELEEKIVGKKEELVVERKKKRMELETKESQKGTVKKRKKIRKISLDSLTLPLNNANDNIRKLRITEKDLPKQKSFELFLPGF